MSKPAVEYGFRRRCAWCGVVLRGWQLNRCRLCRDRSSDAGIYLQSGGPPCSQKSRWDARPDDFRAVPVESPSNKKEN